MFNYLHILGSISGSASCLDNWSLNHLSLFEIIHTLCNTNKIFHIFHLALPIDVLISLLLILHLKILNLHLLSLLVNFLKLARYFSLWMDIFLLLIMSYFVMFQIGFTFNRCTLLCLPLFSLFARQFLSKKEFMNE